MEGDILLLEGKGLGGLLVRAGNLWNYFLHSLNNARYQRIIKYSHVSIFINSTEIVEALSQGVVLREQPYKKTLSNIQKNKIE